MTHASNTSLTALGQSKTNLVMKKKPGEKKKSLAREEFEMSHKDYSPDEITKEALYINTRNLQKLENIRRNTSLLITWLVVIPVIILGLYLFGSIFI